VTSSNWGGDLPRAPVVRLSPSPYFEYLLPGGWRVLAGRTDAANDRLSLRLARPGDLWFHIRGMPGSHVVLRVPPGAEPDRPTRELAAGLAAYHSKARGAGTVAVTCTEARHVSKPRGAAPGTVAIRQESVLKVRPPSEAVVAGLRAGSTVDGG
jgi:predicted ribosome quality control (RQC) complex YloA/Tae2 family protein